MSFRGIVGNKELIEALAAEIEHRPYHAYLLIGAASIGKALVAQSLAHSVLCERSPGVNFCCTPEHCAVRTMPAGTSGARAGTSLRCDCCAACVQIATGVHPDLIYVARSPKRTEVLIEQVRDFIQRLGVRPSRGTRRIAIIDDAESLNIPAQNALLKTIEEPPAHTVIFLVTRSERALLDTMRSRMRPIRFGPLEAAEIEAVLLIARTGMARERAAGFARLARGSLARAFALADGADPPMTELLKALTGASTIDFVEAQALAQQFFGTRDDATANFELIARMLEEMLCCKLLQAELNAPSPEAARMMTQFAQTIDTATLAALLGGILDAHAAVDAMANPRLQAENWWMAARAALRGQ
jgi:DNA polymerase-3 subunit delta'